MQKSKPFPRDPDPMPQPGPASKPTGVASRAPRSNPAAAQSPVEIKWNNARCGTTEKKAIENAIKYELQIRGVTQQGNITATIEQRHEFTISSGKEAIWAVNITGSPKPKIWQILFNYSLAQGKITKIDIHFA
ncbi:uncharacterized protein B0T15DRAFT_571986 [Chaetomium strumarium]|uniref:Uncharacterized protein n=1 Tax=Chaetomium strumarium TaxID=1170767 RepID=A0AAJ0H4G4_9PEZI|nr:hypothetical protein B0T15DRAFT_571986 [Chaetomium strumarium]